MILADMRRYRKGLPAGTIRGRGKVAGCDEVRGSSGMVLRSTQLAATVHLEARLRIGASPRLTHRATNPDTPGTEAALQRLHATAIAPERFSARA